MQIGPHFADTKPRCPGNKGKCSRVADRRVVPANGAAPVVCCGIHAQFFRKSGSPASK